MKWIMKLLAKWLLVVQTEAGWLKDRQTEWSASCKADLEAQCLTDTLALWLASLPAD